MTRLVQVNGLPMVATIEREGFREERDGDVVRSIWLGFWKATVDGRSATADTIEEACDSVADAVRQRDWGDQFEAAA